MRMKIPQPHRSGPLDRIVRRQGTRWPDTWTRRLRKNLATAACAAQPAPSRPDGVNIGNSESPRNLKKRSWCDELLSAGSHGVATKEKAIGRRQTVVRRAGKPKPVCDFSAA